MKLNRFFLFLIILLINFSLQSTLIFGPNGYEFYINQFKNSLRIHDYYNAHNYLNIIQSLALSDIQNNILLRAYLAANGLYDKNRINETSAELVRNALISKFNPLYKLVSERMSTSEHHGMLIFGPNGFEDNINRFKNEINKGDMALIRRNSAASQFYHNAIEILNRIRETALRGIGNNILLRSYLAANGLYDKNRINEISIDLVRNSLITEFDKVYESIAEKLQDLTQIEEIKRIILQEPYQQLFTRYPIIFNPLPEPWKYELAKCVLENPNMHEKLKLLSKDRKWLNWYEWRDLSCNIWNIIENSEKIGFLNDIDPSYILVRNSLNHAYRPHFSIKDWINTSTIYGISKAGILYHLINTYKVHLMPIDEFFFETIYRLIKAMKYNKRLGYSIVSFKFFRYLPTKEELLSMPPHKRFPRIVIYPATGKKYAQYVYDTLKEVYKDLEGLNIAPRYNDGRGSLVYFAQGDADDKLDRYAQYYDESRVYYNSMITGEYQDYHLIA